jgi:hypothetical protein
MKYFVAAAPQPAFKPVPVTITVESQVELDALACIANYSYSIGKHLEGCHTLPAGVNANTIDGLFPLRFFTALQNAGGRVE